MPAKTAARATEGGPSTVSETISARTAARSAGGRPPYPQAITTAARNRRSTAPTSTPRRAKARTVAPATAATATAYDRSPTLTPSPPGCGPLQLQPDVDEVVGRPRSGIAERQMRVLGADRLDLGIEGDLAITRDEEGRVHDHLVADGLVRARSDGHVAQRLEDLADVALGACLQRALHQASVLDAREVRGTALRGDLALQMADVVVLPLDLLDDLVALPEHLEAELDLVLHLEEHVDERAVGATQQLDDVVARLEHGAERHRNDRVVAHDRFVHALVGQHVLAGGVEDLDRRVRDDGRDVLVMHGRDLGGNGAEADGAEAQRIFRPDDAVHVLAAALHGLRAGLRHGRHRPRRHLADDPGSGGTVARRGLFLLVRRPGGPAAGAARRFRLGRHR